MNNPAVSMDDFKNLTEIIKNAGTAIAILIGGGWTFFRFVLGREQFAKIEFNLDANVIGLFNDHYLVELIAILENKGAVRQTIKEWTFDLLCLAPNSGIDQSRKDINFQVAFDKVIDKRPWVPTDWYSTFVDGGTVQRYTYLTAIPADTEYITLYSRFIYPTSNDFHSSQRTFKVEIKPTTPPKSS